MKNSEKQKSPIQNLYGVFDIRAGRYFPPFTNDNHKTAVRAFRSMATSEDSIISKNPEDFRLFHFGDFDPNDGQIDVLNQPFHVCDAVDFFSPPETNTIDS